MAKIERLMCDLCRSEDNVQTLTVVWNYKAGAPWELDMCERCYDSRLGDLREMGRRAKINNVRPQHRMRVTTITEDNL